MRWLKHLTTASSDEKLAMVLEEYGAEGYGIYWLIDELIGQQLNENRQTSLTYTDSTWARKCYVSRKKLTKFLSFCIENTEKLQKKCKSMEVFFLFNVIIFEKKGKTWITINCPNILKYKDEYQRKVSQKSGQTPDKLRTNSGATPEERKGKERKGETEQRKPELTKEQFKEGMKNLFGKIDTEETRK